MIDKSKKNEIMKTDQILTMYNGSTSKPVGKCKVKMTTKKKYKVDYVVVIEGYAEPLLGSKADGTHTGQYGTHTGQYENCTADGTLTGQLL